MSNAFANLLVGDDLLSRKFIQPIVSFAARFYVAFVFFQSGIKKVDDNFMVTEKIIGHFKDDFKVPFIPPEIAANVTTYAELILPILLVIGLFTRPAAIALFVLNAVALYALHTAGWANPVSNWQHIFWGAIFLGIFAYGPSKVSIDTWIGKKLVGRSSSLILKIISIVILSGIGYVLLSKFALVQNLF